MSQIDLLENPTKQNLRVIQKKFPDIDSETISRLQNDNIRVDITHHNKYIFTILHVPEYHKKKRTIESIELDILYDTVKKHALILSYNSFSVLSKYEKKLKALAFTSFSSFFEGILEVVLDDEARIIEHILRDTNDVKSEYYQKEDNTALIRHLTNNLSNISTLKLICDNQDQLLYKAEEYIKNYEDSTVRYQRHYISEELQYAKSFCETLMNSINTKHQVKMTSIMYAYTRFTFVIFLTGAAFQVSYAFIQDPSPIKITFWIASLVTLLGALLVFRKF